MQFSNTAIAAVGSRLLPYLKTTPYPINEMLSMGLQLGLILVLEYAVLFLPLPMKTIAFIYKILLDAYVLQDMRCR